MNDIDSPKLEGGGGGEGGQVAPNVPRLPRPWPRRPETCIESEVSVAGGRWPGRQTTYN